MVKYLSLSVFECSVVRIESACYVSEFAHFEQIIRAGSSISFIEVLLGYVIIGHGRCFGMSSWVVKTNWLGCFSQDIVLLSNLFVCDIPIVIAYNISDWSTWSIWSSIWMLLLWQENSIIWEIMSKSWQVVWLLSSICRLGSWCCC